VANASSRSGRGSDFDVTANVAIIAERLNRSLGDVSATVRSDLEERIPELRGDARTVELLGASVEGNIDTILHALQHDIAVERITAPTAALEYARRLAQHGVPVNALVRAYRLGQRRVTEMVFAELDALDMEPLHRVATIETISKVLFDYIDWISQQVVDVYEGERERWLENQNSIRALKVREVLASGDTVDVDAVSGVLRYPLRWHHVALVLWYPNTEGQPDELVRLQRFLREVGSAAEVAAPPLFVAADRTTAWAWLPYRSAPTKVVAAIDEFVAGHPDTPRVAIGLPGHGVTGFRRSHQQAQRAWAVGSVRASGVPAVVAAADPGVAAAALLGANISSVRDWVSDVLGPLATDSENDARLRTTLRVFLMCGSSYKAAAAELNLHFNSVKYRVGRAVERRGRPIESDRLDVELALLVCHWYGAAVLQTG
jgi:hypothetical protein